MMRRSRIAVFASTLLLLLHAAAAGAVSHTESANGDLSDNWLAPTTLVLEAGSNRVQGSFGLSPLPDVADLDYLAIVVPDGYRLERLILDSLVPGGANSFLGVQSGAQMTLPPTSRDPSPLLGWNHIYKIQEGLDLLPALGLGPLAAGSYTFWFNETDTSAAWSYGVDFQVAAVPEPSVQMALLLGLGLLAFAARRGKTGESGFAGKNIS